MLRCPTQAWFWLQWEIPNQTPRYSLLQRLQRIGQPIALWLTEQEVNMLRHDDVPVDLKFEAAPHALQGRLEDSAACVCCKQAPAMVTAECDEMTLTTLLKTNQSPWH